MYDADDILDLCRIEAEKYSSNSEESTGASVYMHQLLASSTVSFAFIYCLISADLN